MAQKTMFETATISTPADIPSWLPAEKRAELESWYNEESGGFRDGRGDNQSFLAIRFGNEVRLYADCGEPEDNTFKRDWAWVENVLDEAYEYGWVNGYDYGKQS